MSSASAINFDHVIRLSFIPDCPSSFCSLCLQLTYDKFRSKLEQFLPSLDKSTLPTTGDMAIDAVLKVLQTKREKEDRDGISASATDQDKNMVDEAGQPQAWAGKVDSALEILVHNATEEFGFAPRDVYNGVLELPDTRKQHAIVVKLDRSKLKAIVETLYGSRKLDDVSARVVVVHPLQISTRYDWWVIDFKSIRIAKEAVESMRLEEAKHLQETYNRIHKLSDGSPLARWVFKAIVHRMLSDGSWSGGPMPQPIRMVSDGRDPSTLSTNSPLSPSTPDTSLPPPTPLRAGTRAVTRVNFTHKLGNVTLDDGRYYIPTTDNHPLFDSFTIDLDPNQRAIVISVFRIPISSMHEGPAKGYPLIRKIVAHIRELLSEANPEAMVEATVKVAYFLVCPEGQSQHEWQMSVGWNENAQTNDHREDVFCIRVPVSVDSGTPCLFYIATGF